MKILVAYYTQSGNTEKIAKAIHEEAGKKHDAEIVNIINLDFENMDYDLVFLGSPCHSSDIAIAVKDIMDKFPENLGFRLAGFITHAAPTGKQLGTEEAFERWAGKSEGSFVAFCKKKGIKYAGFFNCQGVATPEVKEFIRENVYPGMVEEYSRFIEKAESHPDNEDLENAREFARKVILKM